MGLKLKLSLLISCLVTVVLVGTGLFIVRRAEQALDRANHRHGMTVTLDLARVCTAPMISRDWTAMRKYIEYAVAHRHVTEAMILDPAGRIVMHSDIAQVGRICSDKRRLMAVHADAPRFGGHYRAGPDEPLLFDISVPIAVKGGRLGTALVVYSEAGTSQEVSGLKRQVGLILLSALALSIFFAVLLADYIARPLKHLGEAAEQLAKGNFCNKGLTIAGQDEIGQLAAAFSTMAGQLEHMVCHDSLTGIYNRQMFQHRLVQECAHASRHRRPLALLMIDIDHFKELNDTFGHLIGDEILTAFATLLHGHMRQDDCLARFGGEEFIVIAPDTTEQTAHQLAERLRSMVAEHSFPISTGRSVRLTVSIGVATLGEEIGTVEGLLHAADQALYAAKESGRNRTCSFSGLRGVASSAAAIPDQARLLATIS